MFVEFILTAIHIALKEITVTEQVGEQVTEQVKKLLDCMNDEALVT